MRCRLAVAALVIVPAFAGASVTVSQFPPHPGVMPGGGFQFTPGSTFGSPPPPRAWVNGVYGGVPGSLVKDTLVLRGPAGPLTVQTAARVGLTDAVGAAARCLVAMNPLCLGAAAAVGAFAYSRMRPDPDTVGGFMVDSGANPVVQSLTEYSVSGWETWRISAQAAGEAVGPAMCANAGAPFHSWTMTGALTGYVKCKVDCAGQPYGTLGCVSSQPVRNFGTRTAAPTQTCPASIDPLNPAYSVPAGEQPGPDGKCRTARYSGNWAPVSAVDAQTRLFAYPPSSMPTTQQFGEPAVSAGETIQGQADPITGPASQVGPSTTTTTTTSTETKTSVKTPTYNYVYGGDSVVWNVTNTTVTTTVNNSTQQTTVETTTENIPAPVPEPDPIDPCEADPTRLGCLKLGEPPTDEVPRGTANVSFDAEDFGIAGACPAPVEIVPGRNFDFAWLCGRLDAIRPFVIAVGFLMAGGIVVGGFRLGM